MADVQDVFTDVSVFTNLILIPLSLFPLALSFWYYRKTKIHDYLLLSIYFFYWSFFTGLFFWYIGVDFGPIKVNALIGRSNVFDYIFYNLIFLGPIGSLDALPLALVALRGKYGTNIREFPKWVKTLIGITILMVLVAWVDQEETQTNPDVYATNLVFWAVWLVRLIYYALTAYTFMSTEYNHNKRSIRSRNLWIYSSILWMISMLGFIVTAGILGYDQSGSNFGFDLLVSIPYFLAAILILYNHIAHPESVLITHEQIHRALKLYKTIELKGRFISDFRISHIVSYLDGIPEELKLSSKVD